MLNNKIKYLETIFIVILACQSAFAQLKKLGVDSKWLDGKIVHKNGDEMKGFIRNNEKLGVINFKHSLADEDSEMKSFNEKSILSMEYFDPFAGGYRRFYSFNCKSDETGFKGDVLFEVLKEFNDFAVLTRKTSVSMVGKDNTGLESFSRNAGLIMAQSEGIFFVGTNGELELYLFIQRYQKDGVLIDQSKNKVKLDKEVMKKFMNEYWKEIETFVKKKSLSYRAPDDVLRMVNEYERLENQN